MGQPGTPKHMSSATPLLDGLVQRQSVLQVATTGQGFYNISDRLDDWLRETGALTGLLVVFMTHTSASLLVQGNDDPNLGLDLLDKLNHLAPENSGYRHNNEGPEDVPSHIKSMLTPTQISLPVSDGKMVLSRLQGLFVLEHRSKPHTRNLVLHYLGQLSSMT